MCMHDMQVPTTTYKLYIYKLNACNHLHVIHVLYCYIYKLNACNHLHVRQQHIILLNYNVKCWFLDIIKVSMTP